MDEEASPLIAESSPQQPMANVEAPFTTQIFWILIWMVNNILVTIANKAIFAKADFKYPFALSAVHMACNIIGAQVYFLLNRSVRPKVIEGKHQQTIIFFSVIFCMNIAIGNTSLRWVSVSFNQMARALVPVITMFISILYYKKSYSTERKLTVVPIVIGVALAFYGDISFTMVGAFFTGLCVLLAALKVVIGGEILTGELKLHEIDLLLKMCPLALIQCLLFAGLTGELSAISNNWSTIAASAAPQVVLFTGLLSFSMNICSFIANKVTSPLTLCISANVKQVLVVAVSTYYFGDSLSLINMIGVGLVVFGSYRYSVSSMSNS